MGQTATKSKENNAGGVNHLTDHVIAFDLLTNAKAGVQLYARALTEASTPDVHIMLNKHLDQAISFHEQVVAYIADRGWYIAGDLKGQLVIDAKKAQETLALLK